MNSFCQKKLLILVILFSVSFAIHAQNVGINASGGAPKSSAGLDVDFSNKGILIPRISLLSTTDATTISSPDTSLIVYNTNAAMTNGGKGFWYWNGSKWLPLLTGVNTTPKAPTMQIFTSTGTTTGYFFTVTSANATTGATYTNNGHTFTVSSTIVAGTQLYASGALAPAVSGTLTKVSGTGDATISFSSTQSLATYTTPTNPAPLYIKVTMVGAGGGGAGSGTGFTGGTGGTGGISSFGTSLLNANSGSPGGAGGGGSGGSASLGIGPIGFAVTGGGGMTAITANGFDAPGGVGGSSPLGGAGSSSYSNFSEHGAANTGGGGSGSGGSNIAGSTSGGGGGSGGYVSAIITSPLSSYTYSVGTGGAAGTAGTSGYAGGAGGSGIIIVEEYYQ